jgi:predicted dehydrogenase/nucleoside-diphosphate-sugar epimerase
MHPNEPLLRVGLIGCGKMGLHHVKAIAASGQAKVVGIADPAADLDALRPLIPEDAVIVGDAAEMLQKAAPDVVHIVTPPSTHAELAALAIRAGCHVYVEKPFTPTKAEAERIFTLAAERGVRVCAGHQVLFEPPALAGREAVGSIGRLVHVVSVFSFKMVRRSITPADQLKDILPHAVYPVVDQLRAATGLADGAFELGGVTVDASGDLYALLRLGSTHAIVMVTLNGRPVEQYQELVGTNGSLRVDYISGAVVPLVGPGTGPGVLLTPFRRSFRTLTGATRGIARLLFGGGLSYPGLRLLVSRFYHSIREKTPPPLSPRSIVDTVDICERIGVMLDRAEREQESAARARVEAAAAALPAVAHADRGIVLVTGGTGMLGKRVAQELRQAGFAVRALGRRIPPFSRRIPGVEYASCDLARPIGPEIMEGVGMVIHCAAETAGGREEHRRNSVNATRHIMEAAVHAGVTRAIHVSSLAILKTSRELGRPLDEDAPVDVDNPARGPYVWGKAESERVAQQIGRESGLAVKVIRPGPLVDYSAFHPPGRLGREVGPLFVAIGPKRGDLSVCDVSTAARVIRRYTEQFDSAPAVLNLVEAPAPTRGDLLARFRKDRPDLKALWIPAVVLRILSGPLKLLQRYAFGSKQPIDVAAAFGSERYRTDLAREVIAQASAPAATSSPTLVSAR